MCASIVHRLRQHTAANDQTPICSYADTDGELKTFSQSQVLDFLRNTAFAIGEDRLGFHPNEIGTRSIRTSAAMGWWLAGESVPKIMLMGRWKSDAWLYYIRKQVLEFSKGMATALLKNEFYHALPSLSDEHRVLATSRPIASY